MALEIVLPFGNKSSTKNLIFSILIKEHPLKLIELTNFIRKRYGKSVTFQAVRKATLQLVEENVLVRQKNEFSINKSWVLESKRIIDDLYTEMQKDNSSESLDAVGGDIAVYTFMTLNDLMKFWQNLIDEWFEHFQKGDPNLNCYQGVHLWESLLHPDRERKVMEQLKQKGIISYSVSTGNTPLDKNICRFYKRIGLKVGINPSNKFFDREYYVGTYGDLVIQSRLPEKIVKDLDDFFKKNTTLENFDLQKLSKIVNQRIEVKLTVIRNKNMARHINQSIIDQIV